MSESDPGGLGFPESEDGFVDLQRFHAESSGNRKKCQKETTFGERRAREAICLLDCFAVFPTHRYGFKRTIFDSSAHLTCLATNKHVHLHHSLSSLDILLFSFFGLVWTER